ncbi:MAG: S9 family peptidase [Edafosvirus sp.]|uniref:prolyl oligopeptidase n=1 Tax=Edafosvirus sp. TaxID=2487765 RepID=A0A3G4ZVI2_9VIRU|nr:MAG: S9 family peptidase [Edafosvirus sp.]
MIKYPHTPRNNDSVNDHYEWLEDINATKCKKWIKKQNRMTDNYISTCPIYNKLKSKLKKCNNYTTWSCPAKYGEKYYFSKHDGINDDSIVCVMDTLTSEHKIFLDPNILYDDGSCRSTGAFSHSGNLYAYPILIKGSDEKIIYVKNTVTFEELKDELHDVRVSHISWTHDDRGFFYLRQPKPSNKSSGVLYKYMTYYHTIGTQQDQDILIYNDSHIPGRFHECTVTDDGEYLIISLSIGNRIYYSSLSDFNKTKKIEISELIIKSGMTHFSYITNNKNIFYFKTNYKASNNRVIAVDIKNNNEKNWLDVIPENKNVMNKISCANYNFFVVEYIQDCKPLINIYDLNGKFIKCLHEPVIGSLEISCNKKNSEIFYHFESPIEPGIIYKYNFDDDKKEIFHENNMPGFKKDSYEMKQIFYSSKDGTKISMIIITSKNFKKDGTMPMLLTGYGGFNDITMPIFVSDLSMQIDDLGINYAIANIRGGGEYGEDWYSQGRGYKKQNTFDDFEMASEYLISNNYTNNKKLIIRGSSNGGLLVATCLNQRPDLYGCCIINCGVLDMLKFHKYTVGYIWTYEYGNPEDPGACKYLSTYSPLHNISSDSEIKYPPVLVTTSENDDRVAPIHSYKFIAELQFKQKNNQNPLMLLTQKIGGHGIHMLLSKEIENNAKIFAFIINSLKICF